SARDDMEKRVRALCGERGIRLLAATHPATHTETKTRILAGGISTRRQQIVRVDRGSGGLPDEVSHELASSVRRLAREADAVLVSDYGGGVLGPETIAAVRSLNGRRLPVCVDSRFALATWKNVTVAKPNEPELAALS